MLYFKCPTCKTLLANKQLPYEEGLQSICNDHKLSDKEKDKQKMALLSKLEINNYCCRMRVITYMDSAQMIK